MKDMTTDFNIENTPVVLSGFAQFFSHGGRRFAICAPPPCFIELNDDMKVVLDQFQTPRTIPAVKHALDLDDSIDLLFKELVSRRILVPPRETMVGSEAATSSSQYSGYSHLSIFPTYRCNLACKYCYARGGERYEDISEGLIDTIMAYFFGQLKGRNVEHVALDFHGGGEPTLAFPKLQYALDRFSAECSARDMSFRLGMATNACFDGEVLDWIVANSLDLTVSFDGLEDVQNANRPYRGGLPSYGTVVENVKRLVSSGVHFAVRSTITESSVGLMSEMVDLFASLGVTYLHFEPCFETGRSIDTGTKQPEATLFGDSFLKAFRRALTQGIALRFSGLRCLEFPTDRFCGACGTNLAVTPEGWLTTCYEVVHSTDPASEVFFVGHVDADSGHVSIDESKRACLLARRASKMPECRGCFMQWTCAGDCPVKAYRHTGSIFGTFEDRCRMVKQVNKEVVSMILNGDFLPAHQIWRFSYER